MEDDALLREFASRGSEDAFRELVRRHLNAVYSSARRQVGDPHLAEDITQAVFVVLARKAARIRPGTVMSAWLFTTTRFVARDALKREQRRRHREQEAALMMPNYHDVEVAAAWEQVAPELDAALADLGEKDRALLAMRFFEKQSHAGIARHLGTAEATAKKRVHRAMERLGRLLGRRGVTLSAAMLLAAISSHAVQAAPAGLASAVAAGAVGTAASGSVAALVHGGLKLMAWNQLKSTAATALLAATLIGGSWAGVRIGLRNPTTRFADGSTLSLHETQFTSQYQLTRTTLPKWPTLSQSLPEFLKRRFPPTDTVGLSVGIPSPTGTNSLFVTLRQDQAGSGRRGMNVVRMVFVDEAGEECGGGFRAGAMSADGLFPIVAFPAHPRRNAELKLRVLGITGISSNFGLQTLAEYVVPNPTPGRYPQWTPERFPITREDGNFSVTLTHWETGSPVPIGGRHSDAWMSRMFSGGLPGTQLRFQVNESGQTAETVWVPAAVTWSDATGNQWTQYQHPKDAFRTNAEIGFSATGVLWPGEDAWKARVEFMRIRDFSAEELITLPPVAVPGESGTEEINTPFEVNGVVLQLKSLCGGRARLPGKFQWSTIEGRVNVAVRCQAPREGRRLTLVQALDDRGRSAAWDPAPLSDSPDVVFGLEVPSGARQLSLTFAVARSRFVEFLAAPARRSAGDTHPVEGAPRP